MLECGAMCADVMGQLGSGSTLSVGRKERDILTVIV